MAEINSTPNANRLHIGIFGKTNSGKSSLINAITGQEVSIVSDVPGTTTDPVYKAMEISPLGPCVLIDTAGLADDTALGEKRLEKTRLAMDRTDLAVIVFSDMDKTGHKQEFALADFFKNKKVPVLCTVNSFNDGNDTADSLLADVRKKINNDRAEAVMINCHQPSKPELENVRVALARLMPEDYDKEFITGSLVAEDDVVLLVMPQDIQAPKRRLILPQVQTIRELLDRKCTVICTTVDKMETTLNGLKKAPGLIITDSQAFKYVYEHKPTESRLTSFSVLFAAYKGDLAYYIAGAKAIERLDEGSRVLIAECCTHAPLTEDIGRVKLPRLLRKRFGDGLRVDVVSGTDFPTDLDKYDLIIQCGGCMFNRQYVLSRIQRAKGMGVPMSNYGVVIAYLTGILDKIVM